MKSLIFLIFSALISLIYSQEGKRKMECRWINRSYANCVWYTKDSCCLQKDRIRHCKKLEKEKKCSGKLYFKDKYRIERELKPKEMKE